MITSTELAAIAALIRITAVRLCNVVRATIAVTRRHVPKWVGAVLTACLFIPGPLDELLVLLVIAGYVAFKPAMRSDLRHGIATAWLAV